MQPKQMWTFPRPESQGRFKECLLLWESTVDSKVIESLPWDPTHILFIEPMALGSKHTPTSHHGERCAFI